VAAARRLVAKRAAARLGEALRSIVAFPLYLVSGFGRRDPRRLAFGGNGDRFTDNAKYLPRRDQVRALGGRAELRWSRRGLAEAWRAGWFVYGAYPSDVNFWVSRGARLLNLWHGVPLKAIEFDIETGPLARVYGSPAWSPVRLAFLDRFVRPDAVLSPSPFLSERCFTSAFRVPRDRCLEVGYPRTDHLFAPPPPGQAEVVGYFPTWRDDGRDFLGDAGFSFDELNQHLAAAGRTMVFKAHPNFGDIVPRDRTWSNVTVLDPAVDLNEVLPQCDVLVTDYSSVAFDYLLLDRPIVYFLPDHDRYVGRRNLYFEVDTMTAGPVVTTSEDLYRMLAGPIPDHADERHRLRQLVWGDYDGGACEAVADFLAH
jgi:CDP-glycerol glycerophosphotransferase (TagB/SpsB family)